jgi:hypothetical protein
MPSNVFRCPRGRARLRSDTRDLVQVLQAKRALADESPEQPSLAFKAATLDRSVTPPDAWLSHIQLFPPLIGSEPDDTDVVSCCRNGLRSAGARRRRHSRGGSPADAADRHRINCKPVSTRRCTSLEPARRPRGPSACSAGSRRRPYPSTARGLRRNSPATCEARSRGSSRGPGTTRRPN